MGNKKSVCHVARLPRAVLFRCWSFLDGDTYWSLRLVCGQWLVWMSDNAVPDARFSFDAPLWDISQAYPGAARSFRRVASYRCHHRPRRTKFELAAQCCRLWPAVVSIDSRVFDFVDSSFSRQIQEMHCNDDTAKWEWLGYEWPRLVALHFRTLDGSRMRNLAMGRWTAVTRLTFTAERAVTLTELRTFLAIFVSLRELEIIAIRDECRLSECLHVLPDAMTTLSVHSESDDMAAVLKVIERLTALTALLLRYRGRPIIPISWPAPQTEYFMRRVCDVHPGLVQWPIPERKGVFRHDHDTFYMMSPSVRPLLSGKGSTRLSRPLDFMGN